MMSENLKPTSQQEISFLKTNTPETLRKLSQWGVWRLEPDPNRPGETTKIPYRAGVSRLLRASSTNPKHWTNFDRAFGTLKMNPDKYSGLAFAFTSDDPYVFIVGKSLVAVPRFLKNDVMEFLSNEN